MISFFIQAFNILLHKPLFNALILLYLYIPGHDFGIAIILLTIIIRIILYPLMAKSIKSQKALSGLQPKIQEIQNKYKNNKQAQTKELLELYRKEKINPFGSLLPLLIQFPILIALYRVFWKGLSPELLRTDRYSFVSDPGIVNSNFLGKIDLSAPSLILAILAGILQYFQTKMLTPQQKYVGAQASQRKGPDFSSMMQKQMLYFFPIFTVLILWKLPSAIGLYWIVTSLFSIGQQYLIFKKSAYAQPR